MTAGYRCESCNESLRGDALDGVLTRAAAHGREHHGGPEAIAPVREATLRAAITPAE